MDRWLNKSENAAGSSTLNTICKRECAPPTNFVRFKRENSPFDKSVSKKRKYDERDVFCFFGFVDENSLPPCVLYGKIFLNSSMVSIKSRRHLEINHKDAKDKLADFFIQQCKSTNKK